MGACQPGEDCSDCGGCGDSEEFKWEPPSTGKSGCACGTARCRGNNPTGETCTHEFAPEDLEYGGVCGRIAVAELFGAFRCEHHMPDNAELIDELELLPVS